MSKLNVLYLHSHDTGRYIKPYGHAVNTPNLQRLADGLGFEIEAYNRTVPTRDRREGVRAFNQKRKAEFKGE